MCIIHSTPFQSYSECNMRRKPILISLVQEKCYFGPSSSGNCAQFRADARAYVCVCANAKQSFCYSLWMRNSGWNSIGVARFGYKHVSDCNLNVINRWIYARCKFNYNKIFPFGDFPFPLDLFFFDSGCALQCACDVFARGY